MKDILKKRRCLSHRRYVEHRMAQLQTEIFNDAMATGKVNLEKRQQLLKYRAHLNHLRQLKYNQYLILFKNTLNQKIWCLKH